MNDKKMQSQNDAVLRRPYAAPKLLPYGAVRDLTAGGSKGGKEVNAQGGLKTRKL